MRLSEVMLVGDVLGAMKINKVKDADTRAGLNKWFLATLKHRKGFERDKDELVRKFRSDFAEELARGEELTAEKEELAKAVEELLKPDVEMGIPPVDAEPLTDPDIWGAEDTLGQIANTVALLVRSGVAKEE